jgi:hypothetical protein
MRIGSGIALFVTLAGLANVALGGSPASASTHQKSDSVDAPYGCSVSTPKGTFSYSGTATFTGTTPADASVGATVSISGFQANVSVPGSILDEAYGYGVRSIVTVVTAFDINATDAATPTVNVANKPVKVGHMQLASSGNPSLSVNVPRKPAKVGSWVASAIGTMVFSPGNATLHFKTNLGSLNVQCSPSPGDSSISTTTVN